MIYVQAMNLAWATLMWLEWNEHVEAYADATFRMEEVRTCS